MSNELCVRGKTVGGLTGWRVKDGNQKSEVRIHEN